MIKEPQSFRTVIREAISQRVAQGSSIMKYSRFIPLPVLKQKVAEEFHHKGRNLASCAYWAVMKVFDSIYDGYLIYEKGEEGLGTICILEEEVEKFFEVVDHLTPGHFAFDKLPFHDISTFWEKFEQFLFDEGHWLPIRQDVLLNYLYPNTYEY